MRKDRMVSEVLGQDLAVSPSDLLNANLRTMLIGGYDRDEVDKLLERAADVLERLVTENRRLRQQFEDQREQLQQYQEMEITLRNALIGAHKAGETLLTSARAQADAILEEARLEKARARFQNDELPQELQEEIRRLKDARNRLRADIESILRSHEMLLQGLPKAEVHMEETRAQEGRSHFIGFDDDGTDHASSPARPAIHISPTVAPGSRGAVVEQERDGWEIDANEEGDEQE